MAFTVKIATGVNTVSDMSSEPTWANLTADGSFPSGAQSHATWPDEPNLDGTYFSAYEEIETGGDVSRQPQGGAMADWLFDYMTFEALDFVKDAFCASGYSSTVTIQMPDGYGATATYYGTLWWPTPNVDMARAPSGGWRDITLRFRGLRQAEES